MSHRRISAVLILTVVSHCAMAECGGVADAQFDPLKQITSTFTKTIEIKKGGRLLEFCPDNTCDAFEASSGVAKADLRDFAYLYIYYFSNYYVLQEWRAQGESKDTAERVLAKPKYRDCTTEDDFEAARCVLRDLSENGRINLLFVRYDENKRNVVKKSLTEQLLKKAPTKE
jgi:hypothetical protein